MMLKTERAKRWTALMSDIALVGSLTARSRKQRWRISCEVVSWRKPQNVD